MMYGFVLLFFVCFGFFMFLKFFQKPLDDIEGPPGKSSLLHYLWVFGDEPFGDVEGLPSDT